MWRLSKLELKPPAALILSCQELCFKDRPEQLGGVTPVNSESRSSLDVCAVELN